MSASQLSGRRSPPIATHPIREVDNTSRRRLVSAGLDLSAHD